jgi:RimJ/RimL family protein N-acetyltransferase
MTASERVVTPRLIMRKPVDEDASAIFATYANDAAVTRWLGWPRHQALAASHAFVNFSHAEWMRWPAGPYVIESRESGELLGATGFGFETPFRAATGYVLAKHAWGHGYATEALGAIVNVARQINLVRLYAVCHVDHGASARVLEKCGFAREGILRRYAEFPNLGREGPCDVLCYGIVLDQRADAVAAPSRPAMTLMTGTYSICRLTPDQPVPEWAGDFGFLSVTRTDHELSIVCPSGQVPAGTAAQSGYRALAVSGPLDFALVGIVADFSAVLKLASISIFVVSTYDTDYLLVRDRDLDAAIGALRVAGYSIVTAA